MKRFVYIIVALVFFVSCTLDEESGADRISVSRDFLEFSSLHGQQRVYIESNVSWTVTSDSAYWCSMSPSEGIYSDSIYVTVQENTLTTDRSTTIIVKGEGLDDKKILVHQLGRLTPIPGN